MERHVYARMGAVEDRHWWFVARRRIVNAALARCVGLPSPARVLEAGCGTGGNLRMLSGFGTVSAFEPDRVARAKAAAAGSFDVRKGHLPGAVPFAGETFDLAVMLDVLEHLDDDVACLMALAQRLTPAGWLLVTVPAFGFLWSRHDELHHHKRRYTRAALKNAICESGLELVKASYFNTFLFPLVAATRGLKNLLRIESDENAIPPPWLNAILGFAFALERHPIGRLPLPFGVSLMALARKPGP